jgi:hypothetical protein
MKLIKYVDAAGLHPKVRRTQPEAMVFVCFLSPRVEPQRADSVTKEIVTTLSRLGFVVKQK